MLSIASWSVRVGIWLLVSAAVARADTVTIQFHELADYAATGSPHARIIGHEYDRLEAERDADLQWSNPELAYDREDVETAEEYQLTVAKEFALPWTYLKKKSSWNVRLTAAELRKAQKTRNLLARLETGYVRLALLGRYLERLRQLRKILRDASRIAATQYSEGHISGVERHLIQMSVLSVNAALQEAEQRRREISADWRAALGIETEDSVSLETGIRYKRIQLEPTAHYTAMIESQPGSQAATTLERAFSERAAAERTAFIPSVNLYGGYKKVEPEHDGYVAGVSLNVPLFNRNEAVSRKYEVESKMAGYEAQMYRRRVAGQVEALVRSVTETRDMLETVTEHVTEDREFLNSLLASYEEGWMTLNELLNAVQVEATGLKDYYEQLIRYYENLFELEAITGESLVAF